MDLAGKIALVTGGSRGIGRAVAIGLAKQGAKVAITYASNEARAQEVVAAIEAAGSKGAAYKIDVADLEATKKGIDEIVKAMGGLHISIANAGISIDGLMMRYKDDDLEKIFRTNVLGAFATARSSIFPMMKSRWGRIIFMGSIVGESGNAGQTAYAATKSALDGMAKSLAREVASRNITVNVVAPGFIETDMTAVLPEEAKKKMLESIPLGAIGKAEDVAEAVSFLASDRAKYVTGHVLNVNGGMYM